MISKCFAETESKFDKFVDDNFTGKIVKPIKIRAANGYPSLNRLVGLYCYSIPFYLLEYSQYTVLSPSKPNVCVKYATFLHFRHIISLKVVVWA